MRKGAADTAPSSRSLTPPRSGRPRPGTSPVEVAGKALEERPTFSIRMQVYISVLLLLVIVVGFALATIATTARVDDGAQFSRATSKFLFQTEQARRFEKNFFLHGTNLDDALEYVGQARRFLEERAAKVAEVTDDDTYAAMTRQVEQYEKLLETQASLGLTGAASSEEKRKAEVELRKYGRRMVSFATALETAGSNELERMLTLSRDTQYGLVVSLALYMVFVTSMLIRRIVEPIQRYMEYTKRIAAGDHTPIMPTRRYRDEFSALAIGINDMLARLEHRQDVLVASHKLRAIGTLTAGVAHELNNPINNITLTSHAMLEDYSEQTDEERRDMLQDIIQEAARTKRIVASLLDFARQSESKVEPLDLGEVVRQTLAVVKNQLNLKGVRVALDVMPHLPTIHGDGQQLSQVILNLILNALDVTQKGGKIEISVGRAKQEGFLDARVRDFGSGIPEHIMPFIFDPFFSTKPKGRGTGLGLSISKGIVGRHGGDLTVETATNEGTTFTVSLPITSLPVDLEALKAEIEGSRTAQDRES